MENIKDILTIVNDTVICIKDESIESLIIPEGVRRIGKSAFSCLGGCNLTSVIIPEGVTIIDDFAFWGCKRLNNVVLPSSLLKIGAYAFGKCRFESITIPDNVQVLGQRSFQNCCELKEISFNGKLEYIGKEAFKNNYKTNFLKFPFPYGEKKVTAYKGFYVDADGGLFCRDFIYKEGETYTTDKAIMCECGFHACLNPIECFNYYAGILDFDILLKRVEFHEVEIYVTDFQSVGTKVCGKKITIGRKLTINEMFEAFNKIII